MSTTNFPGFPLSIPLFPCEYRANRPSQVPVHAPTDRALAQTKVSQIDSSAEQVKDSIDWGEMQGGDENRGDRGG